MLLSQISLEDLVLKLKEALMIDLANSIQIGLPDRLITEDELCKKLSISRPTLHRLRKQKKLPFIRLGDSIRYDFAKVLKALEK